MSWFSNNYEKAALGGSVLIAVALGAIVFKNKGEIEDAFSIDSPKKNNKTTVDGLPDITIVRDSFRNVHEIHQADIDGRKVDLFTGVALFSKRDDPSNPVDLLKSEAVHQGIANIWWLKYGLDPGFSDSPDRDPDKDGFSNREEFKAGTDPTVFKSHPDPYIKLAVTSVKTTQIHLKPADFGGGSFMFKLQDRNERDHNKMPSAAGGIKAGSIIEFEKDLMKRRFKFVRVFEVEIQKNGMAQKVKRWEIEDLKPNKAGTKYLFDRRGAMIGFPNRKSAIMDSTIELTLEALGQTGSPFKLEENNRFSLPFDPEATEKPYLLKKVDLANKTVEVEYTDKDGKLQPHIMKFK